MNIKPGRLAAIGIVVSWMAAFGTHLWRAWAPSASASATLLDMASPSEAGLTQRGVFYRGNRIGFVRERFVPLPEGSRSEQEGRFRMNILGRERELDIGGSATVGRGGPDASPAPRPTGDPGSPSCARGKRGTSSGDSRPDRSRGSHPYDPRTRRAPRGPRRSTPCTAARRGASRRAARATPCAGTSDSWGRSGLGRRAWRSGRALRVHHIPVACRGGDYARARLTHRRSHTRHWPQRRHRLSDIRIVIEDDSIIALITQTLYAPAARRRAACRGQRAG